MLFTSIEFPIFFALVLAARPLLRRTPWEVYLLLLASYLFYASGSPAGTLLILMTSTIDFGVALRIRSTEDESRRRRWLQVSLASNLGLLALFKYSTFVLDGTAALLNSVGLSADFPRFQPSLPPGISYFTFTGVSYVLDVYYDRLEPSRRFTDYALHVAYFPKLLAGPIARAGELVPQLVARVRASTDDVEVGLAYFLLGMVKKLAIADQVRPHVDLIFSAPGQFDALTLVQGAVGYSVQIYCDFSGYSDMAIGCARIMGVRLPQNFAMPYKSNSIAEFWRRWHITLSSWFRDYVFYPLEIAGRRSRFINARSSFNLVLTMGLCGLWHGANWTFVLWGLLHGGALACERAWSSRHTSDAGRVWVGRSRQVLSRGLTLLIVVVGWILFRSESVDSAGTYLLRTLFLVHDGVRMLSPQIIVAAIVLVAVHAMVDKDRNLVEEIPDQAIPVRMLAFGSLATIVFAFGATDAAPFLYSGF